MALGMGVVFTFLALLVITTQVMSTIVGRYFRQSIVTESSAPSSTASGDIPDVRTLSIIQEAIRKHRDA